MQEWSGKARAVGNTKTESHGGVCVEDAIEGR